MKTKKGRANALLLLCAFLFIACGKDEEEDYFYPSLITEFVELLSDETGLGTSFTTDSGETYAANTPLQGLQPESVYRIVCGYEPTGDNRDGLPVARIYTVDNVTLLQLMEEPSADDEPTGVAAIWPGGGYLNLQLTPETQGGTQSWGYRVDSVRPASEGRQTFHLSLYHRQPGDPYSYSTTVYASLPLFQLEGFQEGDSLTFTTLTFDGRKTWHFHY